MKILVVAPQPFFSWRGTPFSVYYRTLITCELGNEADVLTYGEGMDVDIPGCRLVRIPNFPWLGPVRTGPSALKLFLDVFMLVWTVALLLRRRYDVVHAHEEAVFWCRWLKPLFGFRLVYDMHSSLPQQLHNFEFTSLRIVHWLFEALEASAIRASDAVIAICPSLRDYARTLTQASDKVVLIENSLFEPVRVLDPTREPPAAEEVPAAGLPGDYHRWRSGRAQNRVVAYAGTLEPYQGIDRLIEAFALVARQLPDAGLLLIGGQPGQVATCRAQIDALGIGNEVFLTGQLPQREAQRLVASATACISPRFSGDNTPLKIYQLMASGVPMIATRIQSHTQVLDDDIAALTGTTCEELAAGIVEVLLHPDNAKDRAERALIRYAEQYSRPVYVSRMRALFAQVR